MTQPRSTQIDYRPAGHVRFRLLCLLLVGLCTACAKPSTPTSPTASTGNTTEAATVIDERTLQPVPLEPGRYKRIVAVSSPSRSGVFSKQSVEFVVLPPEECN